MNYMRTRLFTIFLFTFFLLTSVLASRWLIHDSSGTARSWDWPSHKRTLRVQIISSDSDFREDAENAINDWNNAFSSNGVAWHFDVCTPPPAPDIIIREGEVPSAQGHGCTTVPITSAPGGGYMANPPATIVIDSTSDWENLYRERLIMHELGHCIGMADCADDTNAIMCHAHAADGDKFETPDSTDISEMKLTASVNSYVLATPGTEYLAIGLPEIVPIFVCGMTPEPCAYITDATDMEVTSSPRTSAAIDTFDEFAVYVNILGYPDAKHQEAFTLNLFTPYKLWHSFPFYIKFGTIPPPATMPVAVLPPDTSIIDSMTIVIDGSASYHTDPTLNEYLDFTFIVDDSFLVSSGKMMRWHFSAGEHTVILHISDPFAKFSIDEMHITVELSTENNKTTQKTVEPQIRWLGEREGGVFPISIFMPYPDEIDVKIYDILGNYITTIFKGFCEGEKLILWNSKDKNRKNIPAGIYFATLNSEKFTKNCKIIITR